MLPRAELVEDAGKFIARKLCFSSHKDMAVFILAMPG